MNPLFHTAPAAPGRRRQLLCVYPEDRCLAALVSGLLGRYAPGLTVRSAGLAGPAHLPVHPNALLVGVSLGLDFWAHRSRLLHESDCAWADLVLVQRPEDRDRLAHWRPQHACKLRLLDQQAQLPVEEGAACTEAQLRQALPAVEAVARAWAAQLSQQPEHALA
jgi:protein-tyrosine-phosphatase